MEVSSKYVSNLSNLVQNEEKLQQIIEDAIDWAHCNGLEIRMPQQKDRSDVCQIAPFALFPSPFPRLFFQQAIDIQKTMNLLYFRISWDFQFLREAHRDVIQTDGFTRNMMAILDVLEQSGMRQKITLLTQRADYMCHIDGEKMKLKQIEVNNIAVSMGGLAQRATLLHRRTLHKVGATALSEAVLDNQPIETLAVGLYKAWQAFGSADAILLVIVGAENQNQLDQRYIEYEVERLSGQKIQIVRLTLGQCGTRLTLEAETGTLLLDRQLAVAVVYFRAGYSPDDYPSTVEWQQRELIEQSTAIKCPWIGLQLANTKKVQQVLAEPGAVERFVSDTRGAELVRHTFAGMWGLERDDERTRSLIQDALANPQNYVLKPQLEGGGGNYFGVELVSKLGGLTPSERAAHILMEKVRPLVVQNYLVRAMQQPQLVKVVSELGVYGCLLGTGGAELVVLHNEVGGHILRTKLEHTNEGGVAVGAAVIDTPLLY